MPDPGKIQGPKLNALFAALIKDKTIIGLHVVGTDFQRLTCITAIEHAPGGSCLMVDRPDGFFEAAENDEPLKLRFNFHGPDQLEYIFGTSGGAGQGHNLKIPFPDHVERLQRRKNFRINTPLGTRLLFASAKLKGEIDLINISLGGAFGVLTEHNRKNLQNALFKIDQRLYKIRIIFPADKIMQKQSVLIHKAEVRRIEQDKKRKLYKYAFEFVTIDKDNAEKLTRAIYHIQRQFLQNR